MTPQQIATATTAMMQGKSQSAAGEMVGVNRNTIAKYINNADIQDIIKTNQLRVINEGVAEAVENQLLKIKISNNLAGSVLAGNTELPMYYKTYAELGHDAEKQVLNSVGIYPSHAQSIQVLQLTQINLEISPEVARLLAFDDAFEDAVEVNLDDMGVDMGVSDNNAK